jgi:NAD(P)-dependent dehydrogenase (short-subunit alcohol dehydrogenase family)
MPSPNKIWFITGASCGFGRAFADYALSRGHRVVAAAPSTERMQDLASKAPDRVAVLPLGFSQPGSSEAAIAAAISRFGRIDVLINAQSHDGFASSRNAGDAELRARMETDFYNVMAVTRAALPCFRAQRCGAIVTMTGMGEALTPASFRAYSASKFALEGASEALAQEMAPFGVRVLIVETGQFRTDQSTDAARAGMGDPGKAAAAVETALEADVTPLRLALGSDAVDAMRNHCQSMLADLAKWEPISRAMSY